MNSHLRTSLAAAGAALVLVAAGCGGGSSSSSATSAPAASGGSGGGKSVGVTLKDFSVDVAGGGTLQAGSYTFQVKNDGPSAHNLTISGPGVSDAATPTFSSGETKTLSVTLKAGSYKFFCSVPGHEAAGMVENVTVG